MFEKQIEAAVEQALDRRTILPDKKLILEGYHPLPEIMGALYAWVFVPFRRAEILVEVRFPGQPSFRKSTSFMRSSTSTKTRNFPARI